MTNYDIRIKGDRAIREMERRVFKLGDTVSIHGLIAILDTDELVRGANLLRAQYNMGLLKYSHDVPVLMLERKKAQETVQPSDCVLVQPDPKAHLGATEE